MKMTVVKKEVDTYRALGTGSTGHYAGPQGVGQQAEGRAWPMGKAGEVCRVS